LSARGHATTHDCRAARRRQVKKLSSEHPYWIHGAVLRALRRRSAWLKARAMQIARRRWVKEAIVALAHRLAVIMHRIWVDGTEFRWTREQAAAAA